MGNSTYLYTKQLFNSFKLKAFGLAFAFVVMIGVQGWGQTTATWEGGTGINVGAWNFANNWSSKAVPTATTNVTIPTGITKGYPAIISSGVCASLTIASGASLTIASGGSLTIASGGSLTIASGGSLTNSGSLVINSSSTASGSFINNGTYTGTGNVTYNCYMAANRWYITSAPVSAANFGTLNSTKIDTDPNDGGKYDFATYTEANNAGWQYQASLPSALTAGQGYLISLNSATTVAFTGALNNGNVTPGVTTSTNNSWNAVGNPYTSAIGISSSALSTDKFLTVNSSKLSTNYAAIYVWNESGSYLGSQQYYKAIGNSGYTPPSGSGYENLTGENYIQAGQGFMINVNASTTVSFTKAMQYHSTGTTLKSAETSWPGITLLAESNGQTRSTVVAFNEKMTNGLDVTYDAGLLASDYFQVYTRLVSNDNPVDFTIQCLPDNMYSHLNVPVGLDLPEGGELVFKASGIILPDGLYPVIEDKLLNVKTPLKSETDNYTVTLDKNTAGVGRFYLSFAGVFTQAPVTQLETKYTASMENNRITINGAAEAGTKAMLFDISGRKLGEYQLENASRNEITVAGRNQQFYLLSIEGKNTRQVLKLVATQN